MMLDLETLKAKCPGAVQPIIDQYGPAIVAMTAEEFWAWVHLLLAGDTAKAYKTLLDRMPDADWLAEYRDGFLESLKELNARNNARMSLQREAIEAVLRALLVVVLAAASL